MKNIDILKTIAILNVYDRDFKVNTWPVTDSIGEYWYEFSAKDKDDNYIGICEPGLTMSISALLKEIFGKCDTPYYYTGITTKYLLDDEWRKHTYENEVKRLNGVEEYMNKTKPANDWWKENNPCINCKINKHDHWDDIHHNCSLCHRNCCEILNEKSKIFQQKLKECASK